VAYLATDKSLTPNKKRGGGDKNKKSKKKVTSRRSIYRQVKRRLQTHPWNGKKGKKSGGGKKEKGLNRDEGSPAKNGGLSKEKLKNRRKGRPKLKRKEERKGRCTFYPKHGMGRTQPKKKTTYERKAQTGFQLAAPATNPKLEEQERKGSFLHVYSIQGGVGGSKRGGLTNDSNLHARWLCRRGGGGGWSKSGSKAGDKETHPLGAHSNGGGRLVCNNKVLQRKGLRSEPPCLLDFFRETPVSGTVGECSKKTASRRGKGDGEGGGEGVDRRHPHRLKNEDSDRTRSAYRGETTGKKNGGKKGEKTSPLLMKEHKRGKFPEPNKGGKRKVIPGFSGEGRKAKAGEGEKKKNL